MDVSIDWSWVWSHGPAMGAGSSSISSSWGSPSSPASRSRSSSRSGPTAIRASTPPITAITGLLYTIPSLAAFALLTPVTGLTLLTAVIPLTTYTLLILVRANVAGFQSVPADILEAAEGMGYTRRQRLLRVELPLAVPLIMAGIRLAVVTTIGLATVASILGETFGGFGFFITEGLDRFFLTEIYLGAVLSIVHGVRRRLPPRPDRAAHHAVGARPGRSALMDDIVTWFLDPAHLTGTDGIPQRLFEHVALSGAAILTATVIGLPIGLYIGHTRRFASLAINVANIGRALPSYALVVMILPLSLDDQPRVRARSDPDVRRDDPARDPADPHRRLRGAALGRRRPRRGRPRAWACAPARS